MDRFLPQFLAVLFQYFYPFELSSASLVSRRWRGVILNESFFNNAYVDENRTMRQLINVLLANVHLQNQVRTLTIHRNANATVERRQLTLCFPQLTHIYIYPGSEITLPGNDILHVRGFTEWRNRIVHIQQRVWFRNRNNLFLSGRFRGLTRLIVSFGVHTFQDNSIEHGRNRLDDIVNHAPNLTELTIADPRISLADLETIHGGLHLLTSLSLKNVRLVGDQNIREGMHANNTTTLFISFTNHDDITAVQWLQFIRMNYARLERFSFIFSINARLIAQNGAHLVEQGWVPLIRWFRNQLRYIDASCCFGVEQLLAAGNEVNPGVPGNLARDGLDRHLKVRYINTFINRNRRPLENLGVQGNLIHRLTVTVTNINLLLPALAHLQNLEELSISCPREIINREVELSSFLILCPATLKTLEMFDFDIFCVDVEDVVVPQLWKLSLKCLNVDDSVFNFINHFLAPHLITLALIAELTVIRHIDLDGLSLTTLEISMPGPAAIIVTVTAANQQRAFFLGEHIPRSFQFAEYNNAEPQEHLVEIPEEHFLHLLTVFLTCTSVQKIIVNGKIGWF